MTDALQDLFGELRSLLADADEDHDALVALLERARALDPEVYDATWRPYLTSAWRDTTPRPTAASLAALRRLALLYPCGVALDLSLALDEPRAQQLPALLHDPVMACVERLDLSQNELTDGDIAALTTSPYLRGLRALDLSYNKLTADGVLLIAMTPHLPALRDLNIAENSLTPSTYKKALAGGLFEQLEALDLSGNNLGVMASRTLAATLTRARALETLRISRCGLDDKTLAPLLAVTPAHPLRELSISENPLSPDTTRALLSSPLCAKLDWINLDQVPLPPECIPHDALPDLCGLVVGDLTPQQARALTRWPRFAHLDELVLPAAPSPTVLKHLLAAPRHVPLTTLSICDAHLTPASIKLLAAHPALHHLKLDGCQLTDKSLQTLTTALPDCRLAHLSLSHNLLPPRALLRLLASPLARHLRTLRFEDNGGYLIHLRDDSPRAAPALRELHLRGCYMEPDALSAILAAHLPALRVLDLCDNDLPEDLFSLLTRDDGPHLLRHLALDSTTFTPDLCAPLDDTRRAARLPRLTSLALSNDFDLHITALERLLATPIGARLHHIDLVDSILDEQDDISLSLTREGFTVHAAVNRWTR